MTQTNEERPKGKIQNILTHRDREIKRVSRLDFNLKFKNKFEEKIQNIIVKRELENERCPIFRL